MFTFLRIERRRRILRPTSTATSIACCMRCTFEANDATRMRPVRGRSCRKASPTSRSEPVTRALGVRQVAGKGRRRGCRSPPGGPRRCEARPPGGPSCSRPVPMRPPGLSSTIATSPIEWATRRTGAEGPELEGSAGSTSRSSTERSRPCSSSFDLISRASACRPDLLDAAREAGTGARRRISWPCVRRTARIVLHPR